MSERIEGKPIASPDDTLEVALSLAAAGWPVFPVKLIPVTRADGTEAVDKRPLVKWHEGATVDTETIATWWGSDFPGAWVGVHAGKAGIVVVDVDLDKGKGTHDGKSNLKQAGIELPKTLRYKTRSGGSHHVYQAPEGARLTIGRDVPVLGVDIRAGNGLMVYYGPALDGAPKLAPAPKWSLIPLGEATAARGADGDIGAWLARAVPGKPTKPVKQLLKTIDNPNDLNHDRLLEVVTGLIKLGTERGVGEAYESVRAGYLAGRPDRERDWDNAAAGSIGRLGLPPATLELTKHERKAITERNKPEAQEAAVAKRKAEFRVGKIDERLAKAGQAPDIGNRELTDAALAEEVAAGMVGKWAVTDALGVLRWTGQQWRPATEVALIEYVRRTVRRIRAEETKSAIMRGDKKREDEARGIESRNRVTAIARFAAGILAERDDRVDAHPDYLNTPSGIVDLRTSELMPHDPAMMMTKMTAAPYDPDAPLGDWGTALEALPPKVAVWMQYRFGQAMTGYMTSDDKLVLLRGTGDNGKSVIFNGVVEAAGDYAVIVGDRLLMANPGDHPTEMTVLLGARLAVIEELPEGRNLNVKRLKDTVGTPKMTARRMRSDPITWRATHSLFLSTNYVPIVAETDHGTWKRLAMVMFPFKFVKPSEWTGGAHHKPMDETLRDRLGDEPNAAALRWMIEGARLWYANGRKMPPPPKAVRRDTEAWRHDADPVLAYLEENIEASPHHAITTTDLSSDFNDYLDVRGHKAWSQQTINSRFEGHEQMAEVPRKTVKFGRLTPSRPRFPKTARTPAVTQAWVGVRFKSEDVGLIPSEAELDAAALADLERRAQS